MDQIFIVITTTNPSNTFLPSWFTYNEKEEEAVQMIDLILYSFDTSSID